MRRFVFVTLLCLLSTAVLAQKPESPAEKNRRMAWWKEAKFGLFIHWGLYAVAAGEYNGQKNYGEWLMYEAKIPVPEYEKFAPQFNPTQFNADAWVSTAKAAGMKYIVITSKHHDGFSMFNSKISDYDLPDRTPFKRDPMRELADACRKHGLKLCFYHSIMDWHHPQANKQDFARYRDEYMYPQLKELLTQYGDIGVLWFDGEWIEEWTEDQGKALYAYVRSLQPNIIINNRVGKGRNGMQGMNNSDDAAGDFGTPEQEILGEKSTLDWESCMTMNDHWGYNRHDLNYKPADELIWNLVDIVAKGGNFLLNIGPTAQGTFPPESMQRMDMIAQWMAVNQTSVHGAKSWTHWQEGENIRYCQGKKDQIFVSFRGQEHTTLLLKKIRPAKGSKITMLGFPEKLSWKQTPDGALIELPPLHKRPLNTCGRGIWVLQIKGKPEQVTEAPSIGQTPGENKKNAVFTGQAEIIISATPGANIYYTTDGSEPTSSSTRYTEKIKLSETTTVRAIARIPGKMSSEAVQLHCVKARYGIQLESSFAEKYSADGPLSLVDGIQGSTKFTDGKWLGFEGKDLVATLDLGAKTTVNSAGISFLRMLPHWIFLPKKVEIWGSDDGQTFNLLQTQAFPAASTNDVDQVYALEIPVQTTTRYLKFIAQNQGICPSWHAGAGAKAWLFVDEVWVR